MRGSSPSPAIQQMPRSERENIVARYPALYIEVPRIMSLAGCPMTLRANLRTAFAEMLVGRDLASGRWVPNMPTMPRAGPRLVMSAQMSSISWPYLSCSNGT